MKNKVGLIVVKLLLISVLVIISLGSIVYANNGLSENLMLNLKSQNEQLKMVYVNSPYLEAPGEQNIVVQWGDGTEELKSVTLIYANEAGIRYKLLASDREEDLFRFTKEFSKEEAGIYNLVSFSFLLDGQKQEYIFEDLEIKAYFGVDKEYKGNEKSDVTIVNQRVTDKMSEEQSSGDLNERIVDSNNIDAVESQIGQLLQDNATLPRSRGPIVVVLDPGHCAAHPGASGNGVVEHVAVLRIAQACRARLEQYEGVTVHLTRETAACPFPGSGVYDDINRRVAWASSKGATVLISLHLNAFTSSNAWGAEVYYHSNSSAGRALSQAIQNKLVGLGLHNRGIKTGNFNINSEAQKYGFPGILVEHGFVTNANDVNNFLTGSKLDDLGVANANAIVEYYGLRPKNNEPIKMSGIARDVASGGHQGPVGTRMQIANKVTLTNLKSGTYYAIIGALYNGTDGEFVTATAALDSKHHIGHPSPAAHAKLPGALYVEMAVPGSGQTREVDMVFPEIDSQALAGKTLIVFQYLYETGTSIGRDKPTVSLANSGDANQAIFFPNISAVARDGKSGGHQGTVGNSEAIIDRVTLSNLLAGHYYAIDATLYDVTAGKLLTGSGTTRQQGFTAQNRTETIDVTFPSINTTALAGHTVVVYLTVHKDSIHNPPILTHKNPNNTSQAIHYSAPPVPTPTNTPVPTPTNAPVQTEQVNMRVRFLEDTGSVTNAPTSPVYAPSILEVVVDIYESAEAATGFVHVETLTARRVQAWFLGTFTRDITKFYKFEIKTTIPGYTMMFAGVDPRTTHADPFAGNFPGMDRLTISPAYFGSLLNNLSIRYDYTGEGLEPTPTNTPVPTVIPTPLPIATNTPVPTTTPIPIVTPATVNAIIDMDLTGSITVAKEVPITDGSNITYERIADVIFHHWKVANIAQLKNNDGTIVVAYTDLNTALLAHMGAQAPIADFTIAGKDYYYTTTLQTALHAMYPLGQPQNNLKTLIQTNGTAMTPTGNSGVDKGVTKSSGLSVGLYLIVETEHPAEIKEPCMPFFVSIPSNATADMDNHDSIYYTDKWIYDVTVIPKNEKQGIQIDKWILNNSHNNGDTTNRPSNDTISKGEDYQVGDVVTYRIDADVPSTIVDLQTYTIGDKLSTGLTYQGIQVVYAQMADGTFVELSSPTNYEVLLGNSDQVPIIANNGTSMGSSNFAVKFVPATLNGVVKVFIEYTAILNENALIYTDGNPNHVSLNHSRNTGSNEGGLVTIEPATPEPVVYTYKFKITKTLEGIVPSPGVYAGIAFELRDMSGNKIPVRSLGNDRYIIVQTTLPVANPSTDDDIEVNSATGIAEIIGLNAGQYQLVEIKTAEGYTLLKEPIIINIHAKFVGESWVVNSDGNFFRYDVSKSYFSNGRQIDMSGFKDGEYAELAGVINENSASGVPTMKYDHQTTADGHTHAEVVTSNHPINNEGMIEFTIANKRDFGIPSTGGVGTYIFTLIGLALLVLASILVGKKLNIKNLSR